MSRTFLAAAVGLAASVLVPATASAAGFDIYGDNERLAVKVKLADLHTAKGAQVTALRIRVAATTVCGGDVDAVLRFSDSFIKCREAAIDRAIRQLGSPLLADALGRAPTALVSARR